MALELAINPFERGDRVTVRADCPHWMQRGRRGTVVRRSRTCTNLRWEYNTSVRFDGEAEDDPICMLNFRHLDRDGGC